jgi:hypothetical protein
MLRSWRYWGLLLTTVPVLGASTDEIGGKLRSVIQAHDPGAQVSAPESSPVAGLYQTSIDGVSGYVSADGRYFVVGDVGFGVAEEFDGGGEEGEASGVAAEGRAG